MNSRDDGRFREKERQLSLQSCQCQMSVTELIDHDVDYKINRSRYESYTYDQLIIAFCARIDRVLASEIVRTSEHEKYLNHGVLELTLHEA